MTELSNSCVCGMSIDIRNDDDEIVAVNANDEDFFLARNSLNGESIHSFIDFCGGKNAKSFIVDCCQLSPCFCMNVMTGNVDNKTLF